jgi:TRAP-type C4-dicarboxylate transport system permease small subunit
MYMYLLTRLLMLVMALMMIPWGFQLAYRMRRSMGSALPVSWAVIYAAVPLGCIMLSICLLAHIRKFAGMVGRGEK